LSVVTSSPREPSRFSGYPAVFLGASPFNAPAMFHLMSHLDLVDGVLYAQGGFTKVIHAIRDLAIDAGVGHSYELTRHVDHHRP
jgi:phytoene dehydrogenase-like protein